MTDGSHPPVGFIDVESFFVLQFLDFPRPSYGAIKTVVIAIALLHIVHIVHIIHIIHIVHIVHIVHIACSDSIVTGLVVRVCILTAAAIAARLHVQRVSVTAFFPLQVLGGGREGNRAHRIFLTTRLVHAMNEAVTIGCTPASTLVFPISVLYR